MPRARKLAAASMVPLARTLPSPFKYAAFLAGYRALDINYEDGSGNDYFKLDATIHGPVLGLNFKW